RLPVLMQASPSAIEKQAKAADVLQVVPLLLGPRRRMGLSARMAPSTAAGSGSPGRLCPLPRRLARSVLGAGPDCGGCVLDLAAEIASRPVDYGDGHGRPGRPGCPGGHRPESELAGDACEPGPLDACRVGRARGRVGAARIGGWRRGGVRGTLPALWKQ